MCLKDLLQMIKYGVLDWVKLLCGVERREEEKEVQKNSPLNGVYYYLMVLYLTCLCNLY